MTGILNKFGLYIFMVVLGLAMFFFGSTMVHMQSGILLGGLGFVGILIVFLFEITLPKKKSR